MGLSEPFERVCDLLVVGRERERAIVRDNRHKVLRQQLRLDEPQQGGDVTRRVVETAPAEQDGKDAATLRRERDALAERQPRSGRRCAGLQRLPGKAPDLLGRAVL
ncbi:MAG: hypothetical protein H6Q40_211, partial [Deltaproteobacteria bacterium]|nr:hypothetical protein [Deltaproteobacteria bacterium]